MEVRTLLADLTHRPRADARHVLIYAQGRSGTTLLASLLASTGHFVDLGEPLHLYTREVWSPVRHLRGLGREARGNVVAHVKGSQLVRERHRPVNPRGLLEAMLKEGWTIVYVLRRSVPDQILSECLALERGVYHKTDDRQEIPQIHIEPEEFLERCERRFGFAQDDRTALEGLPHVSLSYEDNLQNFACHQATSDRVMKEIGLPSSPVHSDLRRIGGSDPRKRLKNYDEVYAALTEKGIIWDSHSAVPAQPIPDWTNTS